MNDDTRALLANLGEGIAERERTLLIDLADEALRGALPEATLVSSEAAPGTAAPWEAEGDFAQVLIAAPKSRRRMECLAALACGVLTEDGTVVVVSPKRGAGSVSSVLTELGTVESLEPKAHRRVHRLTPASRRPPFSIDDWRTNAQVATALGDMELVWYPGVFAEGRLDPGSAMLLEHLPASADRGLDLGTGCGVITESLTRIAADVAGVESDRFALLATAQTLEMNGSEATVAEQLSELEGSFDLIVSNPPFHEGFQTTTGTARMLLQDASRLLAPGGQVLIVANRFLPYERILTETYGSAEGVAENPRFRIWRAQGA